MSNAAFAMSTFRPLICAQELLQVDNDYSSERVETTAGKISARRVPVILVNPKTGRLFGGISDPN